MAEDEGFVSRWSRLKSEARKAPAETQGDAQRQPPASADAEAALPAPSDDARGQDPGDRRPPERFDPASLPDVESLTFESDYTAFLQEGVPREVRNRALQRLWRSDPVLANLDGLLEYGEDYTAVGTKKTLVRTAYKVGRGMIDRALENETRESEASPAPAGDADTPPSQEPSEAGRPDETERAEAQAETDEAPAPGPRQSET